MGLREERRYSGDGGEFVGGAGEVAGGVLAYYHAPFGGLVDLAEDRGEEVWVGRELIFGTALGATFEDNATGCEVQAAPS